MTAATSSKPSPKYIPLVIEQHSRYTPPPKREQMGDAAMQDLLRRSLSAQFADHQHFHSLPREITVPADVFSKTLQRADPGLEYFKKQCSGKVERAPWIDIPEADYKVILGSEESEIEQLNQLVGDYHSVDRSTLKWLSTRIERLNVIGDYLESLATQEKFISQKSTILLLNKAVQNKKEYLRQLLEIPPDEAITRYHRDDSARTDRRFEPITMRNDSTYSLKMKEFWGKFWLESIDPCHRRLANYYEFWMKTRPICKNYQSFFLWLESQPIPVNVPVVNYYSDAQLESCRITISNGVLTTPTGEIVNTDPKKRNIFVINLSKELYLETWKEGVWHNSLSRGKPVFGPGILHIEQGIIHRIAFESGHYLPTIEQSFQSFQILREMGVPFKEPFEFIYFENRNKYSILLSANSLDSSQKFYEAIHEQVKRKLISSNEF